MKISSREREVLKLIAYEFTSNEIASSLYISYHTAISYRKHLMEKMQVKNTAGLIRRGFELGILRLDLPNRTSNLYQFTTATQNV